MWRARRVLRSHNDNSLINNDDDENNQSFGIENNNASGDSENNSDIGIHDSSDPEQGRHPTEDLGGPHEATFLQADDDLVFAGTPNTSTAEPFTEAELGTHWTLDLDNPLDDTVLQNAENLEAPANAEHTRDLSPYLGKPFCDTVFQEGDSWDAFSLRPVLFKADTSAVSSPQSSMRDISPAVSTGKRKREETALCPLDDLQASLGTLEPDKWLNDHIVNTLLARLTSDNVGVIDSLTVESEQARSARGLTRLRHNLKGKDTVLIPVCDRRHWRLYC